GAVGPDVPRRKEHLTAAPTRRPPAAIQPSDPGRSGCSKGGGMNRTMLVPLAGIAVGIALAGCGASGSSARPAAAQAAPAAAVTIQTFQFQPGELTVQAGTRVTWTN